MQQETILYIQYQGLSYWTQLQGKGPKLKGLVHESKELVLQKLLIHNVKQVISEVKLPFNWEGIFLTENCQY